MEAQDLRLFRANERIFINDDPRRYATINPNDFYLTLEQVYKAANIPYTPEPNQIYDDVSNAFEEYREELAEKQIDSPLKETEEGKIRAYLVTEIMSRLHLKTLIDAGEILVYRNGIYVKGGEAEVLKLLHELGRFEITNTRRSEVLAAIRAQTGVERSEFDKDPYLLNLRNGILNVMTGEFREHNPNYLSFTQLPVSYNPRASSPEIIKFLRSSLDSAGLKIVVRMLGYCLLKSTRYERVFMLCGSGANGKSTLIKLIAALVGRENYSSVSLQDLTTDRYATAELYGKLVNVFSDLKAEKVVNSGILKVLVSGDPIRAQKKHQQPFSFEPYATLIFAANKIPPTDDPSYSYYRRWQIIGFNRTFEGEERDEHLLEKLTTEEELSGLLNIALIGLKRLIEEKGFPDTDIEDIRQQYELSASKISEFIKESCILEPQNESIYIPSKELQEAYRKYCESKGSSYIDIRTLGEELKKLGCGHKKIQKNGRREYYDIGITLNNKLSNCLDNSSTSTVLGKDQYTIGEKEQGRQIRHLDTLTKSASSS